jgi:hypothetical protein
LGKGIEPKYQQLESTLLLLRQPEYISWTFAAMSIITLLPFPPKICA